MLTLFNDVPHNAVLDVSQLCPCTCSWWSRQTLAVRLASNFEDEWGEAARTTLGRKWWAVPHAAPPLRAP